MPDKAPDNVATRMVAVRIPSRYYKSLRKIGAEHELENAEVVTWALDLLISYERDGGTYVNR